MLDEASIIRALRRLSELLKERGAQGEVCLLGGAVMVREQIPLRAQYLLENIFGEMRKGKADDKT